MRAAFVVAAQPIAAVAAAAHRAMHDARHLGRIRVFAFLCLCFGSHAEAQRGGEKAPEARCYASGALGDRRRLFEKS